MKITKKDLRKLIERLNDQKDDYPRDAIVRGYNNGINRAVQLVEELLEKTNV